MNDDLSKYSLGFLFPDDLKRIVFSIAIRYTDMRWITSKIDEIQENGYSWRHRRDGKKKYWNLLNSPFKPFKPI